MNIQYALICWAASQTGDNFAKDPQLDEQIKTRLKASDQSMEKAIDEAVGRLPESLKQIVRLYYLERRLDPDSLNSIGVDRNAFHLQLSYAEHLITSTVFAD